MPQTDAGAVNGQAFVMETENPDLFYSASARRKRYWFEFCKFVRKFVNIFTEAYWYFYISEAHTANTDRVLFIYSNSAVSDQFNILD